MTTRTPGGVAVRRRGLVVAVVVAAAATITGCSSHSTPPDTSGTNFDAMTLDQLYQGAKAEGKLVLNSGASDDDLAVIAADFNELYPGITIEHTEQQGEDTAAKLAEEAAQGVHDTDVIDIDQFTMYAVAQMGLLDKYNPPTSSSFDARVKSPYYTGYRIQIKPIAYNTDKVAPADVPTGYDDLLDPKWNNKICAEADEVSVFANMLSAMGEQAGLDYWRTLYEHGLRLISGQSNLVSALVSGDCSIAQSANIHSIAQQQEKGAPVAWVKTNPLYGITGAIAVVAQAPHPYAARLWVNYILSDRGQQSLVKDFRIPANPDVKPREPELQGNDYTLALPTDQMLQDFTKLSNEYYQVTGRPVVG